MGGANGLGHLVLGAHAVDLQALRQLVQAAVQVVAELHEVLDVVHRGKVDLQRDANVWSVQLRKKEPTKCPRCCIRNKHNLLSNGG